MNEPSTTLRLTREEIGSLLGSLAWVMGAL